MDLRYEALLNIVSLTSFPSDNSLNQQLIEPLYQLLVEFSKGVNKSQSLIFLEKIIFALGNLATEGSESRHLIVKHQEFLLILIRMMYYNNQQLVKTCLWCLSNLIRDGQTVNLPLIIVEANSVFLHIIQKFS